MEKKRGDRRKRKGKGSGWGAPHFFHERLDLLSTSLRASACAAPRDEDRRRVIRQIEDRLLTPWLFNAGKELVLLLLLLLAGGEEGDVRDVSERE